MNTDPIYSRLGENLKQIRLRKGMSQGDVASKIGADPAYISGIENGRRNVTLATIDKLANALEVDVDKLIRKS